MINLIDKEDLGSYYKRGDPQPLYYFIQILWSRVYYDIALNGKNEVLDKWPILEKNGALIFGIKHIKR